MNGTELCAAKRRLFRKGSSEVYVRSGWCCCLFCGCWVATRARRGCTRLFWRHFGLGHGWAGRAADVLRLAYPSVFTPGISLSGNSLLLTGQFTTPTQMGQVGAFGLATIGDRTDDLARQTALQQILTFDTGMKLIGAMSTILGTALEERRRNPEGADQRPGDENGVPKYGTRQSAQASGAQLLSVRSQLGMQRQISSAHKAGSITIRIWLRHRTICSTNWDRHWPRSIRRPLSTSALRIR